MTRAANRAVVSSFVALAAAALTGCTSFGVVRSAEVQPGTAGMLQLSLSSPPGDEPGWFWSFDCASHCDHSIPGADLGITFGNANESGKPFAIGVGVTGILYPYIDGYLQLGTGRNAYGLGARLGIPIEGWSEHQIYGRYDVVLGNGGRILINPALFYHTGNSPNRQNPGHFLAWVQGIGYLIEGDRVSFIPAASLVIGRGERESYGEAIGPFTTVFATASVSISLHRRRSR